MPNLTISASCGSCGWYQQAAAMPIAVIQVFPIYKGQA